MNNVVITYREKSYEFLKGTKLIEISKKFEGNYKYTILGARINTDIVSLNTTIVENCELEFFDISSFIGNKIYERSAILILVKAVLDVLNKNVRVEFSVDKGIHCIIDDLTIDKLELIEAKMREIVDKNYPIEKIEVNRMKAKKYYNDIGWFDKCNLLNYISNTTITMYRLSNIYDYMYGEMVPSTSYIKEFKLEYLNESGCVLMIPAPFNGNTVTNYVHHEQLYNAAIEYTDWANKIGIKNVSDFNKKLSAGKWNELIFMCEAIQNEKLLAVSRKIHDNSNIKMVLISGPSSSGKTTTSKKLQLFLKGCGLKPYVIGIDDYFKEREETPLDEFGNKDYESVNALDIDLFNDNLTGLLNEEEVLMPSYNFITGKKEYKNKLKIDKDGILIIEGLHSLNEALTSKIDNSKKYKIYISPLTIINLDDHNRLNTSDNRILRRMVRDNLRRGYNASETLESWKRVREGETKYVFPYQDNADVVLNTSLLYEMSVLKVYVEPLLFSVKEDDPNYNEAMRLINILRVILPMPSVGIPLDSIMREFIGNGCFEE